MIVYDRKIFFDTARRRLFPGGMKQSQVDGLNYILAAWEKAYPDGDTRWLGYALATQHHECAQTCQPIEEHGKGSGMAYGKKDPETGQTYYGRGYVQLTWRENYARADRELGLEGGDSCEWNAANALDPTIAAEVMFRGMEEGWFRSGHNFARYFAGKKDDPYNAREIINGDKSKVPSWSSGVSIGNVIKGYYMDFTAALNAAKKETAPPAELVVTVIAPKGVRVVVKVEGEN